MTLSLKLNLSYLAMSFNGFAAINFVAILIRDEFCRQNGPSIMTTCIAKCAPTFFLI